MPTETSCYQSLRAASCNIGELRVVFCLRTKWGDLSLKSPKPTTVDTKGSQSALLASQIYSLQLLSLTTARCLGLETTRYRKENTDKAKPIPGWDLESPQILLGIDICVSFFQASFPNDRSFSKFVAGKCCKVSWNFANLNWLQHGCLWSRWNIRDCNHKITWFHHTSCLQQCKSSMKIALHVLSKVQAKWNQPPLQIHSLPDILGFCESKNRAIWSISWEKGCHIASPSVHKDGISSQFVRCTTLF